MDGFLTGKKPDEKLAEEAAEMAVEGTQAMSHNAYKIQEVRALVKRMVMSLAEAH